MALDVSTKGDLIATSSYDRTGKVIHVLLVDIPINRLLPNPISTHMGSRRKDKR